MSKNGSDFALTDDVSPVVGVIFVPGRQADGVDALVDPDAAIRLQEGDVVLVRLRVVALVGLDFGHAVVRIPSGRLALLLEVVLAHAEPDLLLGEPEGEVNFCCRCLDSLSTV